MEYIKAPKIYGFKNGCILEIKIEAGLCASSVNLIWEGGVPGNKGQQSHNPGYYGTHAHSKSSKRLYLLFRKMVLMA